MPDGAAPPALSSYKNDGDTFTGMFDDSPGWDSIAQGEGTGPPVPGVTLAMFAEMITKRKSMAPYVVAFNGEEAAMGSWRRVAQLKLEGLKNLGVETDRVRVLFGGADKETRTQLWILPGGAPPPVTVIPAEALPGKTVQIGSFTDYDIAEERGERWAFNGFLDVLRSGESLRACIIVRLESDVAEEPEEEPTSTAVTYTPTETFEYPRADFSKMVEKWKVELTEKHKIKPDRFIVLFVSVPRYSGNFLETWIVPAGAALPDPNADALFNADEVDETESGTANPGEKPPPSR